MIKKWSYVAAAMLTATSGLVLTGCIDNDEPYGIEQIRVATANLLEAKKAAVNAAQAAQDAQLEIEKIKAETEKLRIENEKILAEAQAKVLEAEAKAKELEAQAKAAIDAAEAARLQAEAARYQAEADRVKAETEAYLADKKAALDEFIAQAEIRVKKAQQEYDEAVYEFQQQQIKDADKANDELYQAWSAAFQAYIDQLGVVNALNTKYLQTQKDYALAEIDLVPDGNGGWVSKKYNALKNLEKAVADIEAQIAQNNAAIAEWEGYIDYLKNLDGTDFYQLVYKYQADQEANKQAQAEIEAEKAQLKVSHQDLYNKVADLEAEVANNMNKQIEIPAYTWEPDATLAVLGLTDTPIVEEGMTYTLDGDWNYSMTINNYNAYISMIERYLLDENDVAWTKARVNELNRELGIANDVYNKDKTAWQNAKTVYNNGNEVTAQTAASLPKEADVEKAVNDFNGLLAQTTGLQAALTAAEEKENTDRDKFDAAWQTYYGQGGGPGYEQPDGTSAASKMNAAVEKYNAAMRDANNALTAAQNAAYEAAEIAFNSADAAYNTAQDEYFSAVAEYDAIEQKLNANPGDKNLQAQLKTADDAVKAKSKALEKARETQAKAQETAQTKYDTAMADAQLAYVKAERTAKADLNKAQEEYAKVGSNDPAYAPVQTAWNTYQASIQATAKAQQALDDVKNQIQVSYNKMLDAVNVQANAINFSMNNTTVWVWTEVQAYLNGQRDTYPVAKAPIYYTNAQGVYVNAKNYLIYTSRQAYGNLPFYDNDGKLDFEKDEAFLVDNVTKAMVDKYLADNGINPLNYAWYYENWFGSFGKTLYLDNRIAVANAMIDNAQLLPQAIAELTANKEALETANKDAWEAQNDLQAQLDEAQTEIANLVGEYDSKIAACVAMNEIYSEIISELYRIIAFANGNVYDIAGSIEWAQSRIDSYNIANEYQNELLDAAKYQLDQYVNNEGTINGNPVEFDLQAAEAALNAAKEKLEFLKNRADELQAKYEAANK